ncbi:non-ribosomal peptide synthetase/type I polyketide synthase [Aquabacterium sp. CECT 9606]|uniref:non-ribosomal peptide synthetase/type I polyketide synthase n=1 Tax=Aquabacterium sp. CECT 9606 TaxID=2845822 RepID=UPI001E62AC01|nr:non-ribosomal peptide synthetase/type I polyketide synthase [Aquabacterium sp. CECT 9606]CAH0354925.1 D-alanine--D-alanyl carrier protein ligase [Aquabacterium sp. CECT 9606]
MNPPALSHWLRAAADQNPDGIALEYSGIRLNYRALSAKVHQQADLLRAAGLVPGDRIAIAATRSADTVIAILAAVEAGVGYVPLDLSYPADRLQAMLADAQPRVVVGEPAALSTLQDLVGPVPGLDSVAAPQGQPHAAASDLAYVLFTSGSTGRPKGVAMGDLPLRHLTQWHAQHPRLGQAARTLQFAPLSFDVHFQEIFSTLACGGTLVLIPDSHRRDPALLRQALQEHGVERIFLPYVALQMLAQADDDAHQESKPPLALREVVSAGEQLQVTPTIRALFARLPKAVLHNHYGPTESHVVTAFELSGPPASWPGIPPIGIALPHVLVALRDPDTGALSTSETGELLLGGETLAHGYLGQAQLSAERFLDGPAGLPGRWYATGDLVSRDPAGVLTYQGRIDQQLKVDGFRIEPGDIELALMTHESVQDAAVTAPDVPGSGRQLVAHVVLRPGSPALTQLLAPLRQWLRDRLPDYMIPVRFIALDKLPTTPSGKIDRRSLPLPAVEATSAVDPTTLPVTERLRSVWQELLGLSDLADDTNVFDAGARSLLVMRFVGRIKQLGLNLSVAEVYDRPTIAGMRDSLQGAAAPVRRHLPAGPQDQDGIAIIGMSVRADNAHDLDTFWDNLLADREGIRRFAPHELDPSVPQDLRSRPNFVAARGVLEDADRFDAAFFGISAREATVLDPQQRLFLELCWSALEDAAIDPARVQDRIGVYAGSANNTYLPAMRLEDPELIQRYGEFATMLASEKDYVATRAANRLNLRGPAVSIHTACSTSLVAITQAWHALAQGQCDVALAGGVTLVVPQISGYLYVEGSMESADGRCRPFDAEASGTVFASGGGVVVLKRLKQALADGDTVYGVIKGVGLNNDGGDKASFTAPSVSGQAEAIAMALDHAGINARSIGYVEAHGTGTSLGDPIEIAALSRAWARDTADKQFCQIGSIKGHLGHTVAAAGVLGLIKATLSMHREIIPGTLHYRRPNPQIDLANTPFTVQAEARAWPRGPQVRRAAVSSFGVGGTNAHVVLEEAPVQTAPDDENTGQLHLLPLSARSPQAALQRAQDLAKHLERHPAIPLSGVVATLTRGRQPMAHRVAVVASDAASAVAALRDVKVASAIPAAKPRMVFLFPGQGSQHPGMARALVDQAPAFREAFEQCLAVAPADMAVKLRTWLIDAEPGDALAAAGLAETRHAQPALFAVSYALAVWLDSLGIKPQAMIGHSIGEYAAACHAGILSLPDAMRAVIERGQAMFEQPPGAMLAVRASSDVVGRMLPAGVELAAANAPALTVVAGSFDAIAAFATQLEAQDIGTTRLKVSHAFHSASMDGALPKVAQALAQATLSAPSIPVYSCISGAPLLAHEATDPSYWARQVRATVQFSRAVQAELSQGDTVFIEVGPSQALTALMRQHRTADNVVPRIVPLLGPAQDPGAPATRALQAIGALWCAGVDIAWPVSRQARRWPLPAYPFRGEVHWFKRRTVAPVVVNAAPVLPASSVPEDVPPMSRLPRLEQELTRILVDVSGIPAESVHRDATFVDQGLDSLSLTQATLELERVFGIKLRFRRLLEDLDTLAKLGEFLDAQLPADKFAPPPVAAPAAPIAPAASFAPQAMGQSQPVFAPTFAPVQGDAVHQLIQQQMQLMAQQLALLSGQGLVSAAPAMAPVSAPALAPTPTPAAPLPALEQPSKTSLLEKPFGASARITLDAQTDFTPAQRQWLDDFIVRYNARTGQSKAFSQKHRKVMADPRVVTGFNPLWKDLVYPIVADRSKGAHVWDIDGNEYIDLLSCFGANLLGYQPDSVVQAMKEQLDSGIEVGPQHPMSAEVAELISEFTGMERVAFCNTGSEAVMGAMRIARTVTGRKTIAIFTNSYHGIFDEVIVRGTKQLRSLSAAPGILANAVENILVLDYDSEDSLKVLRERGHELAAIMIEPIQNKYPTLQPRAFVQSLRQIADKAGCALIFDEVVTGFRLAPGGAQEFYGVRSDISTYGKIIGGGLPFAAIAGGSAWLDALDGGHWQYGDDSYPEAGVTYFAGTFVRHPLALAAARASLLHLKQGGRQLYATLNGRTQGLVDRLNTAFAARGAPVKAVHCASLWRLAWDDNQKYVSLFYYLLRFHGLHLYEQFGHFVTEAMGDAELDRIFTVFTQSLDELMALGFIAPRDGTPTPPQRLALPNPAPLTPGQTERWLAASFDANARIALNESFCLSLQGDVQEAALEAALQDVLQRHEAFRIHFDATEPQQILDEQHQPSIAHVDLRSQTNAAQALDAFCEQASRQDLSLTQTPLARVSLLRLSDGRVVVHLVASHLVFDGWASSVMLTDLATAYRARSLGLSPTWPAAESPRRFAIDEQARWDGPQGQEDLAFWRQALANAPQPVSLGDRTPPNPRRFEGDTLRAQIDGPVLAALQAKARQNKATLFQVMLAAVSMLIQRRSGQDDFVVSIPYASQSLARHAPLIADGVLDLPLRLQCQRGQSFEAVLAHARNSLMDALEHPLATQGSVARAIGQPSMGSRPPLTGVFFNLNPRVDLSGFAPLQAQMHEGRKLGLLSEVIFNFYETPQALTLDLHHSTEFFSPQRAAEIVADLQALLAEITQQASPISTISAQDLARLQAFNATETAYETGLRLGDLISRSAQQHPHAIAVRFEGQDVTYAQLDQQAWALAHRLRAQGVVPGTLVGVCLDRSIELVAALVGVVYSGGAYVPLDPAYPKERLTHMCEDASMNVIVTRQAEWAKAGSAFPASAHILRMDEPTSGPVQTGPLVGTPQDPAYVIFTSGSTGRPKGAMNAHQGIVNRLQWMQQEYQLTAQDRVIQKTPYSFDVSVWEFFWPLMTGAAVVVAKPEGHRDASYLAGLIREEGVTVLHFVPSMLHLFLEEPGLDQCTSVRQVLCSGEALPIDAVERFFECLPHAQLGNLYGPTEAAVDVTWWACRPHDPRRIVPIGRPIANTRMYVLDEQLRLLPVGAEGELYIGGVQVGMGYVARPDLTAERFLPDPFNPGGRMYKTGDVGRWLDDGAIEYLGRADHQVKIRGNRIELGEIETQLTNHPQVNRCVVVAREFGPGDVRLVAYIVPNGTPPDAAQVKAHLSAQLPEYMLPQHTVILDTIPLLPNGKIDRKALPAPAEPKASTSTLAQAPRNELEQAIAQAMQAMLKVPQIGVDDDFFALGGHSLLAARVIGQLNKQLGLQLTLRNLFEAPSVAKLARAIEQQSGMANPAAQRTPIVHRPQQGTAPLTLMQERIRFIEEMQPGRVVYNAPSAHRLTGPMDLAAFNRAFQEMVRRQPALRTSIVREGDHYIQKTADHVDVSLLPLEDLSHLSGAAQETLLAQRLDALTAETFDLGQAPLLKMRLFKLSEQQHALFFMTHHVLWDGWSFDILYTEISALYEAYLQGQEPALPPLPITYGDYAEWHQAWLQSQELKDQVAYWTKQFATGPLPKAPVGDVPRQLATNGLGSTEWMHMDNALVEQVREVAKQTGSTVSIVMLSVYAALMSQWLGDSQPAIGMPVRGRTATELEGIMGFFNNMLPIRLAVNPNLSCLDWIKSVRQTMVDAFASQDAPFEVLARELDGQRAGAATRLYQVMFSFQDARQRQTHWGPLAHERIPLLQKGATEDLNLWMVEIPGGIEGGLQYNAELLLPATVAALRDRFLSLLGDIVRDPRQPVRQLLAASPAEQDQLKRLSQAALPTPATVDVIEVMNAHIQAHPARPALRIGDQSLSFGELGQRIDQVEGLLRPHLTGGRDTVVVHTTDPVVRLVAGVAALRCEAQVLLGAMLPSHADHAVLVSEQSADAGPLPWVDTRTLLGARIHASASPAVATPTTPSMAVSKASLSTLCAALSQHSQVLPSDQVMVLEDAATAPSMLLQALQTWIAQACLLIVAGPQSQDGLHLIKLIKSQSIGQLDAPANTWRRILAARQGATLSLTAWLQATESTPDLVKALLDAGCTVLSCHRPSPLGLPVTAELLTSRNDSGVMGRPLLAGALSVVDEQDHQTLLPLGAAGLLRLTLGKDSHTGVPARWRSDGRLQSLEEQIEPVGTRRAASANPGTSTEQLIAKVWEDILGLKNISLHDNFFDLGGTSLQVMQAVQKIEQTLGKRISPQRYVFDTLAQLAVVYDADTVHSAPATPPAATPSSGSLMQRIVGLVRRA